SRSSCRCERSGRHAAADALGENRRAPRRLRTVDPPRQADRHAAPPLAHADRAEGRDPGRAVLGHHRDLHARHAAHALGGLRHERLRRSQLRCLRRANPEPTAGPARDRALGSPRPRCRACAVRVSSDRALQSIHDSALDSGAPDRDRVPVLQAFFRAASGIPRSRLLFRHPDGLRGGLRNSAGGGLVAVRREFFLGRRLRHRVRDGRSRRRCEAGLEDLGDCAGTFRCPRGHALLRSLPRAVDVDRPDAGPGSVLLRRTAGRVAARTAAFLADPRAGACGVLPRIPRQPLAGARDLRRNGRGLLLSRTAVAALARLLGNPMIDLQLSGKVAVVTGGSKGIGWACAEALAREGAKVVLVSRSLANFEAASARWPRGTAAPPVVAADVIRAEDAERMAAMAEAGAGPIDILVNSAGAALRYAPADLRASAWRHAMDAKFFTYIHAIDAVLGRMVPRGRGAIVNIIGMGGKIASPVHLPGGAANAA